MKRFALLMALYSCLSLFTFGQFTQQVSLAWNHADESGQSGEPVNHYNVYRSGPQVLDAFAPIGSTLVGIRTYVDPLPADGNTYAYAVSAIGDNGNESALSAPALARTALVQSYPLPPGRRKVVTTTVLDGDTVISTQTVVSQINAPPVVDAGVDQSITLPTAAALAGSVQDDGLLNTPTTTWSKVSGPGTVTFGNPALLNTSAAFSVDGSYVLRLSAYDGEYTVTDDLTVTVQPAGPVNQPPTLEAGNDQAITLPADTVQLAAVASDDGLVDPLSYSWSQVSGPATVAFSNATAADTAATFTQDGVYVLEVSVYDGQYSVTDTLAVTVNPAPAGGGVSYRGISNAAGEGGQLTSITLSKPAGTAENDLLVAFFCVEANTNVVSNVPAGWSLVSAASGPLGGRSHRLYVYQKRAGLSEGGSYAWTFSGTFEAWGGIASFYTSPGLYCTVGNAGLTVTDSVTDGNAPAPSITTQQADNVALHIASTMSGTSVAPPAGYTERLDGESGTGANNLAIGMSCAVYVTAGATGVQTAVFAIADYKLAVHLEITTTP